MSVKHYCMDVDWTINIVMKKQFMEHDTTLPKNEHPHDKGLYWVYVNMIFFLT